MINISQYQYPQLVPISLIIGAILLGRWLLIKGYISSLKKSGKRVPANLPELASKYFFHFAAYASVVGLIMYNL